MENVCWDSSGDTSNDDFASLTQSITRQGIDRSNNNYGSLAMTRRMRTMILTSCLKMLTLRNHPAPFVYANMIVVRR
jgi:hypothetical protein